MILTAPRTGAPSPAMLWLLLGVCAILPIGELIKAAAHPEVLFPDFFGLWSFGRFVLSHAPATIYNDQTVAAYQQALGLPHGEAFYPFPYPPWILMVLGPFGALPYDVAHPLWLALTFAAYAASLTVWRWSSSTMGLLLLVPSSAICFLVGQNGFLTAALMIGGVRLLPSRPCMAGVLLASLAYKPQLALLAPFLLVFGGHWRALFSAGLWTTVLSVAATALFGSSVWGAWLGNMHEHAASLSSGRAALLDMMPTATSAVFLVGGGALAAHAAQIASALFGLFALWRTRGRTDPSAQAVFPLAAILAAPYAFDYDLPAASGALLALIATTPKPSEPPRPSFILLMAGLLIPGVLFARAGAIAAVAPMVFFALVWALTGAPANASPKTPRREVGRKSPAALMAVGLARRLHAGRLCAPTE